MPRTAQLAMQYAISRRPASRSLWRSSPCLATSTRWWTLSRAICGTSERKTQLAQPTSRAASRRPPTSRRPGRGSPGRAIRSPVLCWATRRRPCSRHRHHGGGARRTTRVVIRAYGAAVPPLKGGV
jgi:hypothetical protein